MKDSIPPVLNAEQIAGLAEHSNEKIDENPVASRVEATLESMRDQILLKLDKIKEEEKGQEEIITETSQKVQEIRHELGIGDDTAIPSLDLNKRQLLTLEQERIDLEARLDEILLADVSHKYADIITEAKESKIDWATSAELGRRLKLKGATDEDVDQVREWLVSNVNGAKTFVLPPAKFREAVAVLDEMTGQSDLFQGEAFHVPGGRDDVPEHIKSSIFLQEDTHLPLPPIPGTTHSPGVSESTINKKVLSHELGHVTQDGLLQSELYGDWNPRMKNDAPDPEYVGSITETDTRIRSMYNELVGQFDPKHEKFGTQQLELLKKKRSEGRLSKDTVDLLAHFDDNEIIKMANEMPAI